VHRQLCRQVDEPRLAQISALERDRNLTVDVGRRLLQVGRRRIHDLLELERVPSVASINFGGGGATAENTSFLCPDRFV